MVGDAVPEPKSMAPADVVDAAREQRYGDLIGVMESQHVEFKRGWYRLSDDEREKWELAKDIGAMANAGGGIIVRGVVTRALPYTDVDVAVEVKPIPTDKVDIKQHRSVVKDHLYPKVLGLRFDLFTAPPADDGTPVSILVITVPEQNVDTQPFIVGYAFSDEGRRVDAINIPVRDGAHTDWQSRGVIHRDLADGRRSRVGGMPAAPAVDRDVPVAVTEGVTDGVEMTDRITVTVTRDPTVERAERMVDQVETFMGWTDATTYALVAVPTSPSSAIPDDFYQPEGLAGALTNPPAEHYTGFNLSYGEAPQRLGQSLVVSSGRERCLWLEPDGTFAAGVNAAGDLLTWPASHDPDRPRPLKINQLVLTEYTYLFARFVNEQLRPRFGGYRYAVLFLGATDRPWTLTLPAGYPPDRIIGDGSRPTGPNMVHPVEPGGDPGTDAYRLLTAVFDFFALARADIRFTEDHNQKIDPATFRPQR